MFLIPISLLNLIEFSSRKLWCSDSSSPDLVLNTGRNWPICITISSQVDFRRKRQLVSIAVGVLFRQSSCKNIAYTVDCENPKNTGPDEPLFRCFPASYAFMHLKIVKAHDISFQMPYWKAKYLFWEIFYSYFARQCDSGSGFFDKRTNTNTTFDFEAVKTTEESAVRPTCKIPTSLQLLHKIHIWGRGIRFSEKKAKIWPQTTVKYWRN